MYDSFNINAICNLPKETFQPSLFFFLTIYNLRTVTRKKQRKIPSSLPKLSQLGQHKITIDIPSTAGTELIAMRVIQFLFVYILQNSKTAQANCQARCEETNAPTNDTRLTNRALVGHSFKNFTVNKPYDCHLLCFVKKCRCQAYQMKGQNSCELLDEDRFAAPDCLIEEKGYEYYDMNREYEREVKYYDTNNMMVI